MGRISERYRLHREAASAAECRSEADFFDDPSFEYFFNLRRVMEKEDKSVEPYADVLASNYHVLQQFLPEMPVCWLCQAMQSERR
ncbi:hypothetical protein ACFTAO_14230 [Paenibacillus rhizoplanae]